MQHTDWRFSTLAIGVTICPALGPIAMPLFTIRCVCGFMDDNEADERTLQTRPRKEWRDRLSGLCTTCVECAQSKCTNLQIDRLSIYYYVLQNRIWISIGNICATTASFIYIEVMSKLLFEIVNKLFQECVILQSYEFVRLHAIFEGYYGWQRFDLSNIFNKRAAAWKCLRATTNPVFTGGVRWFVHVQFCHFHSGSRRQTFQFRSKYTTRTTPSVSVRTNETYY